jgi:hypothetical protein
MLYRGYSVTLASDKIRWQITDARNGTFLVSRPSQNAACAWIDQYEAYLANRASDARKPQWRQSLQARSVRFWRKERP